MNHTDTPGVASSQGALAVLPLALFTGVARACDEAVGVAGDAGHGG